MFLTPQKEFLRILAARRHLVPQICHERWVGANVSPKTTDTPHPPPSAGKVPIRANSNKVALTQVEHVEYRRAATATRAERIRGGVDILGR